VLEAKIPLRSVSGRIDHRAVDLKTQRLLVAELGNDSLGVVDHAGGKVLRTLIELSEPQGVGYEPTTDTVYVSNAGDGSIRILRRLLAGRSSFDCLRRAHGIARTGDGPAMRRGTCVRERARRDLGVPSEAMALDVNSEGSGTPSSGPRAMTSIDHDGVCCDNRDRFRQPPSSRIMAKRCPIPTVPKGRSGSDGVRHAWSADSRSCLVYCRRLCRGICHWPRRICLRHRRCGGVAAFPAASAGHAADRGFCSDRARRFGVENCGRQ